MGIMTRIEDADLLFKLGKKESALLLVLIAVAATSRRRYPDRKKIKDGLAFSTFVSEEMSKYAPGWKETTEVQVEFLEKPLRMPAVLYEFVRCKLIHEAELPNFILLKDEQGLNISVIDNERLVISEAIFHYLKKIVIEAPENAEIFYP